MAIRLDISVDWSVFPRIVTVAAPSVLVSIQDIVDTLRDLEYRPDNWGHKKILVAVGKEFLTATLSVGITATLQDARLAFEDRGGPSFVRCDIVGGNLLAVDEDDVGIRPIEITDFTYIVRDVSETPTLVVATGGSGGTKAFAFIG